MAGSSSPDALFALMIEYQKILDKEAREDRRFQTAQKKEELIRKAEKLSLEDKPIDEGMKEAKEKADIARSAAIAWLITGIIAANLQIAGGAASAAAAVASPFQTAAGIDGSSGTRWHPRFALASAIDEPTSSPRSPVLRNRTLLQVGRSELSSGRFRSSPPPMSKCSSSVRCGRCAGSGGAGRSRVREPTRRSNAAFGWWRSHRHFCRTELAAKRAVAALKLLREVSLKMN